MADEKAATRYYKLRGINQKSSKYEFPETEALALYNLDFDTPNAWSKRPGSTYALGSSLGTSGPIQSLFEFSKLTGESFIVAGSDTALFYLAAGGFTLLASGWNNGQPPDMLTFVNKMWAANGQNFSWFDGSSFLPAGLRGQVPVSPVDGLGATYSLINLNVDASGQGGTFYYIGGATCTPQLNGGSQGASVVIRAAYMAYTYVRSDGHEGSADFLTSARNILAGIGQPANNSEVFSFVRTLGGFTVPPNSGITAVNLYLAVDTIRADGATQTTIRGDLYGATFNAVVRVGSLGFLLGAGFSEYASATLIPNADLSRFTFYTAVPASQLFQAYNAGVTQWCCTFAPGGSFFDRYNGVAIQGFSGMTFDFYSTFTPKYIEVDQNSMFMAGFSAAPSTLWYSEVGQPETILEESSFEVRSNDGDRIYATKAFNNQLIVMKENSFHKVIGDSSDNYQLIELSTQYGCLSNKSVVQVKQSLFWLDKKGILEYNGASFDIVSTPVEGIFRRMNISAAKEKACAVHHLYRNQIWFGIPVDSSTVNNLTVVYDYLVGAWTFFDGFNPSSFGFIKGPLTKPTVWRGDYSGMIHFMGESFFSDSTRSITCLAVTRFENTGGENQTTLWRRFFLDVAKQTGGTGQILGSVFSNYDQSTVQATFAMYQDQFQTRAEMGVVGKAIAAQVSHSSASLPLLINGYSWATRGLRNV